MNLFVIISVLAALSVDAAFSRKRYVKSKRECRYKNGSSYRGFVDKSSNGHKCLNWRRVEHTWGAHTWGAEEGIGNHNYCRNPNNKLMPWCYVQKEKTIRKRFCNIPECERPTVKPTVKPKVKPTESTAPPVDTELTCGERHQRRMNKIVGGSFIPIESHPWIAAIFQKRSRFLCGGSLISPCWVLTAAHCFPEGKDTILKHLSMYLGKSATNESNPEREQSFSVEKLIIHQNFNELNYNNDIALLKIKNDEGCAVKMDSVRTVCLPPPYTQLPPGVTCNIAGFGKENFNSWHYSQLLKQAEVTLLPNAECKREVSYEKLFTENMFCAASPDWSTDACKGDSGGPLVCEAAGRMFLFGVVSWGEGCASVNKPGVYTQVTQYNKWIAAKTGLLKYTNGLMYPQK
ncbi:tissue-type plasminogen activator-like [Cololabis saira]|uniref:tissue-type plasminogen activator-like n=1 Tax=Cololabis saira TaxID=129043 RepID=UPI002AD2115F|nr:tissue-type plasminogen activator-like [Cololabis saira]